MKLLVLGGTGQTGQEVVKQALQDGHTVTAVVRNPAKLSNHHQNLKVVEGDVLQSSSLAPHVAEKDAVVSCLGFGRAARDRPTGYKESIQAIVESMRQANVSRLVAMTSWYSDTSCASRLGFFVNWVLVPMLRPMLDNMHQMEQFLKDSCQDIDYTIVRPPALKNGPRTNLKMSVTEEAYHVSTGHTFNGTNRSDVAAFMLSCLTLGAYSRKMVAITTVPKLEE